MNRTGIPGRSYYVLYGYDSASGLPAGIRGTIAGMGNPIVWWAALAGLCALVWRQISGRACRAQGSVLVLYLVQLLPWGNGDPVHLPV